MFHMKQINKQNKKNIYILNYKHYKKQILVQQNIFVSHETYLIIKSDL